MATGTGTGPVNAPKKKRQKRQKTVKQPGLKGSTLGKTPKQKSQKKQKNQGPPTSKQPGTRGSTLGKAMRPGKAERLERREERQKFKAAKKLVKERDADGKVVNYAFNAARDTGIALDATEGSTLNKLLNTRAVAKNEADQKGLTVRQWKKGKQMSKRKMKKQIKASDPFIRMGANPGGESGGVHAKDVHLSDLKGKEKRQANRQIRKATKGRPGDFQDKAENRLQQMNTIRVGTPAYNKAMKKKAKATAKVEARTAKSEKKLQRKFDKKRHASGGVDHGKVSYLKGPYKPNRSITLTLDKTTGKLTRTKKKF